MKRKNNFINDDSKVLFIVYPLCGMYNIAFFAIDLFQK